MKPRQLMPRKRDGQGRTGIPVQEGFNEAAAIDAAEATAAMDFSRFAACFNEAAAIDAAEAIAWHSRTQAAILVLQ